MKVEIQLYHSVGHILQHLEPLYMMEWSLAMLNILLTYSPGSEGQVSERCCLCNLCPTTADLV
jgi:hypothetical protein